MLVTRDMQLPVVLTHNKVNFPVVVKCASSTGSKDVLFAASIKELEQNAGKLRTKNPRETIIIEEYVVGDQYLVEVLVTNQRVQIGAIIRQEITKGKRFIVTGYGVLAEVPSNIAENCGSDRNDCIYVRSKEWYLSFRNKIVSRRLEID